MELTPIKMRGKGPRKTGYKQPNPKRQKPDKNGSDSDVAVFKKGSAAPIEYLPTEILHRIHLFSRENNLPRASLRIGKVLSHPSFHADLVFQAFAPTWDVWYGCRRDRVRSYDGWYQDVERFGGDPDLQSKVIALPFMTQRIVAYAMDMWVRKHGEGRHYQHASDFNSDDDVDSSWDDDEAKGINDGVTFSSDGSPHRVRHDGQLKPATECLREEFHIGCVGSNSINETVLGYGRLSRLEVHPSIRIPDRLITGPLKTCDVKLLFWLVHNNAKVADDQGWEMTLQGVRNIFKQDDPHVARLVTTFLFAAGGFKELPEGVEPISIDTACQKVAGESEIYGAWDSDLKRFPLDCTWKCVVDDLFDLAGMREELTIAYRGKYKLHLYHASRGDFTKLNGSLYEWGSKLGAEP